MSQLLPSIIPPENISFSFYNNTTEEIKLKPGFTGLGKFIIYLKVKPFDINSMIDI
jgi:hypothetical protein